MVNKRSTKLYTQQHEIEDTNAFLISENCVLKKKNDELAKCLAETKIEYQKLSQASLDLQGRLHFSDVENLKLQEFLKSTSGDMQSHIQAFITLTEHMTNTLKKVNMVVKRPDALNYFINSSPVIHPFSSASSASKTAAVMPMISGHTILSPTIHLSRVPAKQLTDMMNASNHEEEEEDPDNNMEADEIEFADNALMNEDDPSDSLSEESNQPVTRRLETMLEVDEEEEEEEIASPAVLSAVFKDVKVYISPLSTPNIQFRNKSTSRRAVNKSRKLLSPATPSTAALRDNPTRNITAIEENAETLQSNASRNASTTDESDSSAADNINDSKPSQIWDDRNVLPASTPNLTNTEAVDPLEGASMPPDLTNIDENDPLEGSSSWHDPHNIDPAVNSTPTETSTPIGTATRTRKRKQWTRTPSKSSNYITVRSHSTRHKKSSVSANCSVALQKISSSELKIYMSNYSPPRGSLEGNTRVDSPTVLERSGSSSVTSRRNTQNTNSSLLSAGSPKIKRKRNTKEVCYKELSINRKERR